MHRLKKKDLPIEDVIDIYCKQVRSVLEFGVPVWNSGLKKQLIRDIERVQKTFLYIIYGNSYRNYHHALEKSKLETLEDRRLKLCETFAIKTAQHSKHNHWFKLNRCTKTTRIKRNKFVPPRSTTKRFTDSPIPYLTYLLNKIHNNNT